MDQYHPCECFCEWTQALVGELCCFGRNTPHPSGYPGRYPLGLVLLLIFFTEFLVHIKPGAWPNVC